MSGAALLVELDRLLSRYVAFPSAEALTAVVLWIAHCHALDAFDSTPRLAFLSPEKGSGKTRSLEVIGLLVPDPMHAVNISAAALYRVVADRQPTLLLDEADTYLGIKIAKQHEDLRGLINAGHRRGATVYRGEAVGNTVKVVEFPAFAACALAGIGDLPDTILDRSVIVAMKRRAPHEHVDHFRDRVARPEAENLRNRLSAWATSNVDQLRDVYPEMPASIVDRAADVWEPLIAIADLAGDHWPATARTAAVALNTARVQRDPSLGVQLLADCRRIFDRQDVDRLPTEALLESLIALDEAPWGELRGKPLDARGLARRLRKYDVHPDTHRFDETTRRGYRREDFHDAWQRYLTVTDVADVAHPKDGRDRRLADAPEEAEEGYDLLSIPLDASLSKNGTAQQAQQTQHCCVHCGSRDVAVGELYCHAHGGADPEEVERLAALAALHETRDDDIDFTRPTSDDIPF